ncbi:hypothetical protein VCHE16_2499 [Vibrio paracholerae HE-16]|nr:hypothetical protein VCHE09_1522 [Vibrio paracholerae HE-09]EKG85958.1 hypothetical protein VCHE16_2499 [Vibrio paracholerae HE-16]EMP92991.1 hypothetical protein VC87395_001710 [Vibrio paracholerae 87395]
MIYSQFIFVMAVAIFAQNHSHFADISILSSTTVEFLHLF